jgi:hypothetical protein
MAKHEKKPKYKNVDFEIRILTFKLRIKFTIKW